MYRPCRGKENGYRRLQEDPKAGGMGLQVPWFNLTASSSGNTLTVQQIEFRSYHLSCE